MKLRYPNWLVWGSLTLVVIGLLDSAYLTYEHFTASTTLACIESGVVNCHAVTTSEWSRLFGIPVALLGLMFFLGYLVLCLPRTWRRSSARLDRLRIAYGATEVVMVGYLVWAEMFRIHAICLWCTGVHVVTVALVFLLVAGSVFVEESKAE